MTSLPSREIRIRPLGRQVSDNTVRARASIKHAGRAEAVIWFEVSSEDADVLSESVHPFVIGAVIPAMRLRAAIRADDVIDAVLARNLVEVQRVFASWYPDRLARVPVYAPLGHAARGRNSRYLGVCFSAGLDSLHAVLRAAADPLVRGGVPGVLIPVHGFDISLAHQGPFEHIVGVARRVAADLGWRVIPVRTNVKEDLHESDGLVSWTKEGHGAGLASAAHALGNGLQTVYVGSSNAYKRILPWGSTPLTDHLWSGIDLDIFHAGADGFRMEKILEVAQHRPDWLGLMRVCNGPVVTPAANCGRCEKCVRTALAALAVGAIDLVAPAFRTDIRRQPSSLLGAIYTTDEGIIDLYFDIADKLETRAETRETGRSLRRRIRYLRPGPLHQAVHALDQSYLGGALDRYHSRLMQVMSRRQ